MKGQLLLRENCRILHLWIDLYMSIFPFCSLILSWCLSTTALTHPLRKLSSVQDRVRSYLPELIGERETELAIRAPLHSTRISRSTVVASNLSVLSPGVLVVFYRYLKLFYRFNQQKK